MMVKILPYIFLQDEGNFAQSTSVKITVEDVNDLGIEFIYPGCNQRCSEKNVSYFSETNESYIVSCSHSSLSFFICLSMILQYSACKFNFSLRKAVAMKKLHAIEG